MFQTSKWLASILIDIKSGHLFSWSKTRSDFGDNEDLKKKNIDYEDDKDNIEIKTNYGDDKDDNEIMTNYRNDKNNFEIKTNYGNNEKNIFLKVATYHNPSLFHFCIADISDPDNDTISITKFDMIQSSTLADFIRSALVFWQAQQNENIEILKTYMQEYQKSAVFAKQYIRNLNSNLDSDR